MGVMKMGNIASRPGIELTSLAFLLTTTPPRLPYVTTLLMPTYLSLAPYLRKSFYAYNELHTYTYRHNTG